jgi:hypothetical protein
MWRSFFLAVGITLCILGAECLVTEKAILKTDQKVVPASLFMPAESPQLEEFTPPEWAPWTLLSVGAVVILYSYSIPRRNGG